MKIVSWEDIDRFVNNIVLIDNEEHFTGVFGIARGGLIPATIISYRLDIPLLQAPCKGCLIVDDISDTGKSLSHYLVNETNKNRYFIATLYYKEGSLVEPNYYLEEKSNEWVVFPWETIREENGEIRS